MTETTPTDTVPPETPGANPPPPAPPPAAPPADEQPPAEVDAQPWQHPDYAGPLDINQAAWRNRNIKPVEAPAQTKSAGPAKGTGNKAR